MSSCWSDRILVKSASLFTEPISVVVVVLEESADVARAPVLSVPSVESRPVELSASTCDTEATWLENCTICSLLCDSALTSICRFLTVPNRSVRESPSRPAVCDSSRSALRNESPLPSNVVAAWSTNALSGPCSPPSLGPSCADSLVSSLLDLVPFHRHAGAVQPDGGAVGQRRARRCADVVGRGELNEPGRHQVRRHDDGACVGGNA